MKTLCMCCGAVMAEGAEGPDGQVSHGLGECCWDAYRKANGLPPRPYPVLQLQRAS